LPCTPTGETHFVRFAYADPPYLGQARKHYGLAAREVNHPLLIAHLEEFDGWALSLSAPSLRTILPMCPEDVRVCAWVKPFAAFKKNVTQAYAWEPVIVKPLRRRPVEEPTVRDWVSVPITLQRGVSGAKPAGFCNWLFEFAGLTGDDEFVDLFPGSGAVQRAWDSWSSQLRLSA
jgi:hypothetical protein